LLGRLFFAEKIELLEGLALSLSIGGLMMIYSLGSIDWQLINYVFLALLGGVGTAVWNVFSKKVSGNYSATQLNGLDFALFTILTLVVSLLKQEQWLRPEFNTTWLANLLFALIFVCTGQLVIHGFKYLDSQKGSLIMLLEIVFGVIVGLLAYQEALGLGAIAGGTLILVGAALPNLPVLRKQKFS
jgi:drug/metabolite transporter (DMT)-like permease